ncbi:MAG: ATP-binding protein [Syntrophobacteraceae bacterium]
MHNSTSLKRRLLFSLWLLLVLGVLLPFWFYHRNFNREIIAESKQNAIHQLNHLCWLMENEKTFQNLEQIQNWLSLVAKQLDARLTFIGLDGRPLADSQLFPAAIGTENLSTRPEFIQALSGDMGLAIRPSETSGQEHILAAKKISLNAPLPTGVMRVAFPFSPFKALLDRAATGFVFLLTIIFTATFLISWGLIRRLRIPISEMTEAVDAIGEGDYRRRIAGRDRELYPLALAINRMADRINQRAQKTQRSARYLDAVFDGMQEGVMVLNPKGKIIEVNRAFRELVTPGETCVGKNPLEVLRNLEFQEACERIVELDAPQGGEQSEAIEVPFGRDRIFGVNIVKPGDKSGELGAIVVFHEISNLKRLEKVRQDFVSNVSRELNTPLISIKAHAQKILAENHGVDDRSRISLVAILEGTNHLLSVVKDLLQLAALDSSPVRFRSLCSNPAQALEAAWDECRPAAVAKNIELVSDLPEVGIEVAAGIDQLTQVFRNLLANGIKYSPEGGRLNVEHSLGPDMITFTVQDEGPGIARQHQDRIFERFYRAGKPASGALASSGLGLAICKHIVQNHGGTIGVRSPKEDQKSGAAFFFSMHLAQSNSC